MVESTGLLSQRSEVLGTSKELPSPLEPMLVSVFPAFLQLSNMLLQSDFEVSRSNFVISKSFQAKFGHQALGLGFAFTPSKVVQMAVYVIIQLILSSFIGFSLSCHCLMSHFTSCSCFSCALASSFPSPRVLKPISLGWSNQWQKLFPDVHTPSPILHVPYQTLPIPYIRKIPHFCTNPSFQLQLGNFLGWACVLPFSTPSPHSISEIPLSPAS